MFNEAGQVVGVASATLKNASNIGYIIPSCVVHLFFASTADTEGKCLPSQRSVENPLGYCGVADLGVGGVQRLENPVMRKCLGIDDREGGVRVVSVDPLGGCVGEGGEWLIRPDDVLLEVDGKLVGQDGTVELPGRPDERIQFSALVSCRLPYKPIKVTLVRKGDVIERTIIPKPRQYICPRVSGYDAKDPALYLICGGCVFTTLTRPWVKAWNKKYDLLLSYYAGPLTEPGRQIVVLSTVLASSVNVGYHNLGCLVVREFDGVEIFSLQHLATLIQNSTNPILEFRMNFKPPSGKKASIRLYSDDASSPDATKKDEQDESNVDSHGPTASPLKEDALEDEILMVLDREKCKELDPEIRNNHLIASACSPELNFNW